MIIQFTINPFPNSTFVFRIQTSSLYSQKSVRLKCNANAAGIIYSDSFDFVIASAASTVVTLGGST